MFEIILRFSGGGNRSKKATEVCAWFGVSGVRVCELYFEGEVIALLPTSNYFITRFINQSDFEGIYGPTRGILYDAETNA